MRDEVEDEDAGASSSSSGTSNTVIAYINPRASRNLAEKQRRDNLNAHIATMAALVPAVSSGSSRKKDKISVLRLTAAHLRLAYTIGQSRTDFLPRAFNDICLIDNVAGPSGFLLILTTTGKIVYISEQVEQHLGHDQSDMIGDSMQNYVYKEDLGELMKALSTEDCFPPRTSQDSVEENSNSSSEEGPAKVSLDYSNFQEKRRFFHVRMAQRSNSRREAAHYECIQIIGVLRLARQVQLQLEHNLSKKDTSTGNDIIFVSVGRLLKKRAFRELSLLEANKNEYFTRHLMDGTMIYCDQRISIVAGYMSDEVCGKSAFSFIHKDDTRWTMVALRDMYVHGKNCGSSCYRLLTKTGDFIYLRTHGYLEYDKVSNKFLSFICVNTLISSEEGEQLIADMKKRFSATILTDNSAVKAVRGKSKPYKIENTEDFSIPSIEDQDDLQEAISGLISDLPTQFCNEEIQPSPLPNAQFVKVAVYSQSLPSVSVHASKIGIKEITAAINVVEKGGKGKQVSTEKLLDEINYNEERKKPIAEKKIPELENIPDTVENNQNPATDSKKAVSLSNITATEIYPEPVRLEENVEASHEKLNLKRSLSDPEITEDISPRKKAEKTETSEFLTSINPVTCVNKDREYSSYVQDQSVPYNTNLQPVQTNYCDLDTNTMVATTSENQFIDYQDEQLLHSAMENNPEMIKFFTNLPPTILEDAAVKANLYQYPTTDQVAVTEGEVRHTHLQIPDSISSCESQFSDIDEQNVHLPYDSFT